ncbi:MAG TPA: PEGA domain-containing protein [bacterium]|nr:PEGA domain-containing protein [bacterium]HMZ05238.1 PEGA domain-containing protein [bacterium]HNB09256.1 PEGA domain-containing protein [bacterium]HNB56804.1 PEGA domain-containing protein [bacterium]HNC48403.1 PEGA domain-containing protein [bacterium]
MPLRYMLAFFCVSALLFGQDKKPSIAVLDFKASEGLTRGETATLTNRFRGILVQTEAFNVVEQEKMNEILKAQDFSMSDACNTAECAVQVGQLLGVERMIAGDIGKIGDVFTIDLRLIDVSTGKIVKTVTRDYEGKISGLLGVMKDVASTFAAIKPVSPAVGSITIQSTPSKATVSMDGKELNFVTPFVAENLTLGVHEIALRLGTMKAVKTIEIKEGKNPVLNLRLEPITAPLSVASDPAGATVFVNGDRYGDTPLQIKLPIGSHTLTVKQKEYEVFTQSIVLKENDPPLVIQASLTKKIKTLSESSSNKKWWYILGGAAVLGGGTAWLLSGGGKSSGKSGIPPAEFPN